MHVDLTHAWHVERMICRNWPRQYSGSEGGTSKRYAVCISEQCVCRSMLVVCVCCVCVLMSLCTFDMECV